jgi:hypothetical protein
LVAAGWDIIGIARHAPGNFSGQFVTTDLSDPEGTAELALILAGPEALTIQAILMLIEWGEQHRFG